MMKIGKGFCMITAISLMISGCGASKKPSVPANSFTPTLEVSAVVNGHVATLQVTTDLKLSKEHYNHQRIQGEGHAHVSVNKGEKIIMTDKHMDLPPLDTGTHEVKVSLHNNDHTPYDVSKTIMVEVK